MPTDGHCDDCGGHNFVRCSDVPKFGNDLAAYQKTKDDLLSFYNNHGTLIDFEVKQGYDSYDKLKRTLQYNIKH